MCVSKHFRDFQWTWTKDKNRQKTKFSILITLSSSSWYCILSLLQNVFDKITARFDFSIHCLLFSSELESKCHLGRNSDIKSKFVNGFLENLFLKQFEWLLKGHSKVNKNELATHFFSIWNQIRQSSPTSMCACACVLESVGVSVYGRGCVFDCVIWYQQAMEKNASAQNYRNKMISYLVFQIETLWSEVFSFAKLFWMFTAFSILFRIREKKKFERPPIMQWCVVKQNRMKGYLT